MVKPKKSLGQNWLHDRDVLYGIAQTAELTKDDTVLEVGPGLGTLTSVLLKQADRVIAVEYDEALARKLPDQFPGTRLEVHSEDILQFDLSRLPADYKVVANVPYYITSPIVRRLVEADNPPSRVSILVQKEVAERIAAHPGDMSLLAISAQVYCEAALGPVVDRSFFTPVPKVDSQVVVLVRRKVPLVGKADRSLFFRLVKAGFIAKRKKLRSSLAGGLRIDKRQVEQLLHAAGVDMNARAEDLAIEDWMRVVTAVRNAPGVIL